MCMECKERRAQELQESYQNKRESVSYIIHVYDSELHNAEIDRIMIKLWDMRNTDKDSILTIAGFTTAKIQKYLIKTDKNRYTFQVSEIQKFTVCVPLNHSVEFKFHSESKLESLLSEF